MHITKQKITLVVELYFNLQGENRFKIDSFIIFDSRHLRACVFYFYFKIYFVRTAGTFRCLAKAAISTHICVKNCPIQINAELLGWLNVFYNELLRDIVAIATTATILVPQVILHATTLAYCK